MGLESLAGLSPFASLANGLMSYFTHQSDKKFNAEQAEINRQWQEKMWNLSNEYNTPLQQMARFKEAGLNPNLVYGDGATTLAAHVGNVSTPSAPADNIKYPDLGAALLSALNMKKVKADIDNIEAEELVRRETAKNLQTERGIKETEGMWLKDSYQLRLDQLEADNELKWTMKNTEIVKRGEIQANVDYLQQQSAYIESETENKKRLTDKEIEQMDVAIQNSIKTTAATIAKMDAEQRKALAEAAEARVRTQVMNDTQNTPEYKEDFLKKYHAEVYKAIQEGNVAVIEKRLLQYKEDLMIKPGERGYGFKKFMETYVNPVTESLGKVFGGNAGVSVTKKM